MRVFLTRLLLAAAGMMGICSRLCDERVLVDEGLMMGELYGDESDRVGGSEKKAAARPIGGVFLPATIHFDGAKSATRHASCHDHLFCM
jgi:hypothetical protein